MKSNLNELRAFEQPIDESVCVCVSRMGAVAGNAIKPVTNMMRSVKGECSALHLS